jgi:hypothetical protein
MTGKPIKGKPNAANAENLQKQASEEVCLLFAFFQTDHFTYDPRRYCIYVLVAQYASEGSCQIRLLADDSANRGMNSAGD